MRCTSAHSLRLPRYKLERRRPSSDSITRRLLCLTVYQPTSNHSSSPASPNKPSGNRVATICRSLGMTVQFAERKGVPLPSVREGKVHFEECLRTSTTLFLTLPLSPESLHMISTPEFALMQNDILVINVSRGGIIDEDALVQALKAKHIGGAATDVVSSFSLPFPPPPETFPPTNSMRDQPTPFYS
jgi:hypothetical protein